MSAAAVVSHPITVLPPGPARPELTNAYCDRHFRYQGKRPVSAEYDGAGFQSPGISFEDYSRMATIQHKQSGERRLPTPQWALRPDLLRSVIVHFVERRAALGKKAQPGTERERLERASQKNVERCKRKQAILQRLCAEFVELKRLGGDPVRAKKLSEQIQNLDTCLRIDRGIAGTAIRVVHLYYSVGLDSVGVATELGLKPPHVRQMLWKLNWVWDKLNGVAKSRDPHYERLRRRRFRSKINIRLAAKMVAEGKSYREISTLFGVSHTTIMNALRNEGFWTPRLKPDKRLAQTIDSAQAVELYKAGKSVPEIALAYGYAPGTGRNAVRNALIRAGIYKFAKPVTRK